MAEWLRRVTRNHVGFARPGSSPGGVESFLFLREHQIRSLHPWRPAKFILTMEVPFEGCSCTNSATLQEHSKVTESILSIYSSDKSLEWKWEISSHIRYLRKCLLDPLPEPYTCLDASQPWLCYWAIHSLELLDPGNFLDEILSSKIKSILQDCKRTVHLVDHLIKSLIWHPLMQL